MTMEYRNFGIRKVKKMRKLLSVLLIVLVGLSLFTACSPESKVTEEELVNVRLTTGSDSRALSASVDFDTSDFTWKYTAKKADTGLKTGETTSMDEEDAVALTSRKETAALSQGKWNFTLYGYADTACTKLVCTGSASNQLITTSSHTVTIEVEPKQEKTGNIWVKDDIYITDIKGVKYSNEGTSEDIYTRTIGVYKAGSTDALAADSTAAEGGDGYITYTSARSGIYKVIVTYTFSTDADGSTATAATATKYINVYDYLTTKVEGSISETAQAATINISNVKIDANGTYSDTQEIASTNFSANSNGDLTNSGDVTVKSSINGTGVSTEESDNSTFTFPSNSLTKNSDAGAVTMNYEFASPAAVNSADGAGYTTSQTMNGAAVGGIGAELEGATYTKSEDGESGTLKTKVESGLTNSDVNDNTTDSDNPLTLLYTDTGENGKVTSYNTSTGALEAEIPHFSKYILVSKDIYAIDSNGKVYLSLADAVAKTTAGSTIKLLQEVKFNESIKVTKNLTIDLNGKTITAESNALIIVEAGTLTVNNANKQTYIKGVYTGDEANSKSTYTPALMAVGDNYYDSFESAIEGASKDATITLLSNVELTKTVEISKSLTLDLNNKAIITNCRAFCVHSGTLTIKNGKIDGSGISDRGQAVIKVDAKEGNAGIKLESNATIVSGGYGIVAFADLTKKVMENTTTYPTGDGMKTATLDIYGKIESLGPCISGNGTVRTLEDGSTDSIIKVKIEVHDGATLNGGIYQPNDGKLNISGGTITSKVNSAVEIRAGRANISGGELSSSGSYSVTPNGNGTTVTGAAVAVSQHSTKKAIEVTITGGTFSGAKKLAVVNTLTEAENIEASKSVKVTVPDAVIADTDIDGIKVGDDTYYPTLEAAVSNAQSGKTIKLLNDVDLTYYTGDVNEKENVCNFIFNNNITLEMNNKTITSNNASVSYEGDGLTIQHGKFVSANGGSYALFIWPVACELDKKKNNITLDDLEYAGGINVVENVVTVKNIKTKVDGTKYYALYAGSSSEIIVESGNFSSTCTTGDYILYAMGDNKEGKITVKGGEFTVPAGKNLCYGNISISGGKFNVKPDTGYLESGYEAKGSDSTWTVEKNQ